MWKSVYQEIEDIDEDHSKNYENMIDDGSQRMSSRNGDFKLRLPEDSGRRMTTNGNQATEGAPLLDPDQL